VKTKCKKFVFQRICDQQTNKINDLTFQLICVFFSEISECKTKRITENWLKFEVKLVTVGNGTMNVLQSEVQISVDATGRHIVVGSKASRIHHLGNRCRSVVIFTSRPFYHGGTSSWRLRTDLSFYRRKEVRFSSWTRTTFSWSSVLILAPITATLKSIHVKEMFVRLWSIINVGLFG